MDYEELNCTIKPFRKELAEILTAQLSDLGFESFVDHDEGFNAYIPSADFDVSVLGKLIWPVSDETEVSFDHKLIKQKNWNAVWESNFQPVVISGKCMVRAPFHEKDPSILYDLIIEPKMSFGTAHHETTELMIQMLFEENISGRKLLDMGCGTGVLAILAHKLGAGPVTAIDNDEWAYENSLSNIIKNNSSNIIVQHGDASSLQNEKYDVILANINRNILLNDIPAYIKVLNKGGSLIMSGFYEKDLPAIKDKAEGLLLKLDHLLVMNEWVVARFLY